MSGAGQPELEIDGTGMKVTIVSGLWHARISEGLLAPCDPKLAAFTLAGALSWIGRWYDPNGPLGAEAVARESTAILMKGLAPRSRARRASPPLSAGRSPSRRSSSRSSC